MPGCLKWFTKNDKVIINKDAKVSRTSSNVNGHRIRRKSDYDKILSAPSPPRPPTTLPVRFQNGQQETNSPSPISEFATVIVKTVSIPAPAPVNLDSDQIAVENGTTLPNDVSVIESPAKSGDVLLNGNVSDAEIMLEDNLVTDSAIRSGSHIDEAEVIVVKQDEIAVTDNDPILPTEDEVTKDETESTSQNLELLMDIDLGMNNTVQEPVHHSNSFRESSEIVTEVTLDSNSNNLDSTIENLEGNESNDLNTARTENPNFEDITIEEDKTTMNHEAVEISENTDIDDNKNDIDESKNTIDRETVEDSDDAANKDSLIIETVQNAEAKPADSSEAELERIEHSEASSSHRPTIVELKLQEDAASHISENVTSRSSGGSNIDDAIYNVSLDEDIPVISRRSGLRPENIDMEKDIIKYEKKLEENMIINEALLKNEFLKNILTETTRRLIVDIMVPQEVHQDEIVIKQGDPGDNMYVSELGHYQVVKDDLEVYTFNKNEVFGEVAIIYNHKRQATVKALTNGKLWKIHRDDYYRVMVTSAKEQETEIMTFLKTVPKIQDAPTSKLQQAVGLFTLNTFTANTNIVVEGQEGNEFFIIRAGIVKVTKQSDVVAKLSRGQYFGEHALLNNDNKRQATVTAESPIVECLVLSCVYFRDLFGDMAEFITMPTIILPKEPVISNEYSYVKLEELKLGTTLGVGGFGRVELAYLIKDDKKTFALKYLKRKRIVENEQVEHVFNEKHIQMECSSPFIVQLYKTYNDRKYLYLLLELCLGGDIINLLQRQRLHCCKEEDTKFLAGCVLEALNYLHDRKFVFRDLKPENMMLDPKGYVKLTDFGFAKKLEHGERTYTFAGTPEYVAPEIIYQRGHDRAVDYWAFGIFIFELLVGKTPFKTADPSYMQTYNLIVRGIENVIFPTKVKNNAAHLIKKLCNAVPSERMGYKRQGIQEIRDHKWFQGFNWEKLQSCKMGSPFIPKLHTHLDTKYFDKQRRDRDIPDDDFTVILNNF